LTTHLNLVVHESNISLIHSALKSLFFITVSEVASLRRGNSGLEASKRSVTLGTHCTEHQKKFEILFLQLRVCNELASPSACRDSTLQTVQGD